MKKRISLLILGLSLSVSCTKKEQKTAEAPTAPPTVTELSKQIVKEGAGKVAEDGMIAVVHYTGTFLDGRKFDSSLDAGKPFSFVVGAGQVIKGWDIGVRGMKVGEKVKLLIPSEMAYGDRGVGPIPPNTPLAFEVELLDVMQAQATKDSEKAPKAESKKSKK